MLVYCKTNITIHKRTFTYSYIDNTRRFLLRQRTTLDRWHIRRVVSRIIARARGSKQNSIRARYRVIFTLLLTVFGLVLLILQLFQMHRILFHQPGLELLVHKVEAHEVRDAIEHPPVVYQNIPHP